MNPDLTPSTPSWVVIGAGAVARSHVACLAEIDAANLLGVVDPDLDRARALAEEFGVGSWPSVDALALDAVPQAATVAVPNHLHLPVAQDLLRRGIACLVEKPLVADPAEGEALIEAAAAAGRPVGAILNMRYLGANQAVAELCHAGRLRPRRITISGSLVARAPGTWRTDPALAGSGLLHEVGIHFLDLVQWWCGRPDEVVGGATSIAADRVETVLVWDDGPIVEVLLTAYASAGQPVEIHVDAPEGTVRITGATLTATTVAELTVAPDPTPTVPLPYGPGHLGALRHAAELFRDEDRFPVDAAEGARSVELADRVRLASLLVP